MCGVLWVVSMLDKGGEKWVKSDEYSRVLVVKCEFNIDGMSRQIVS